MTAFLHLGACTRSRVYVAGCAVTRAAAYLKFGVGMIAVALWAAVPGPQPMAASTAPNAPADVLQLDVVDEHVPLLRLRA